MPPWSQNWLDVALPEEQKIWKYSHDMNEQRKEGQRIHTSGQLNHVLSYMAMEQSVRDINSFLFLLENDESNMEMSFAEAIYAPRENHIMENQAHVCMTPPLKHRKLVEAFLDLFSGFK